jgi:hypothetical protein
MTQGWLWYDGDPSRSLTDKITIAAARYRAKFGQEPCCCRVHPSALESGDPRLGSIRVIAAKFVPRHHLLLSGSEPSRETPLAA